MQNASTGPTKPESAPGPAQTSVAASEAKPEGPQAEWDVEDNMADGPLPFPSPEE